jgi:hypothetical protein
MIVLSRWIEHALDVPVQRPHHAYALKRRGVYVDSRPYLPV